MRRQGPSARRGERRAHCSYYAHVRIAAFSLLALTALVALGTIRGSEPTPVYAQPLTPLALAPELVPTATPTTVPAPTASPTAVATATATPRTAASFASSRGTAVSSVDLTVDGIISLIRRFFPEDARTAKAVFRAESGLNPRAKNWNCYYRENGRQVSKTCRVEDRGTAWSVDCGLTQINQTGTECPSELFDVVTNLKSARAKYEAKLKVGRDPWSPWSAYLQGSYKQFLD